VTRAGGDAYYKWGGKSTVTRSFYCLFFLTKIFFYQKM